MLEIKKPKVYFDEDADTSILREKIIAIIGYGNQGRAQALNMRDEGLNIIIGSIKDSCWDLAVEDGFQVFTIDEAAKRGDIILMLIPDEYHGEVFRKSILRHLKDGDVLVFAHGYSIAFGSIIPSDNIDVVLVAPRMTGKGVRELYVAGKGFPCFIDVAQDYSGNAKEIALALSKAIGATKYGVLEYSFYEEAVIDIFHEQAVGAIGEFFKACFEVLTEHEIDPVLVLMEFYMSRELAIDAESWADAGLFRSAKYGSETCQYGLLTRSPKLLPIKEIKKRLKDNLGYIANGYFAKDWELERIVGKPVFNKLQEEAFSHVINKVEDTIFECTRREKKNGETKQKC